MSRRALTDVILVLVVGIGWGLLAPASKVLFAAESTAFDGFTLAVARAAWSLPIFAVGLGVAWWLERPRLPAFVWAAIGSAGLIFGFGISLLYALAAQHTSVSHMSFIIGSAPVTNSAAAALVFRLPLDLRARIALVLGILGVALLSATHGGSSELVGDVLMLVWLVAFASYACLLRVVGPRVSSTFVMSAVGVVAMGAVVLAACAAPQTLRAIPHVADSVPIGWWFFGEVIGLSTILAQTAYAASVRRLGITIATIGAEYTALAVGIASSLVLHEPWSWVTVVAGAILVAALGVTFVGRPAQAPAAANA